MKEDTNKAPTISNLQASKTKVVVGKEIDIICEANDPDGDQTNFNWFSNGGILIPNGSRATFKPITQGRFTVTVVVTDSKGKSSSQSIEIKAMYLWLGTLGGQKSEAWAVSNDGTVVGNSQYGSSNYYKPFVWKNGTMEALPGADPRRAYSITKDGKHIVGQAKDTSNNKTQASIWSFEDGKYVSPQFLGDLGGASQARDVSLDGKTVVGYSYDAPSNGKYRAFVWKEGQGIAKLDNNWKDSNNNEYSAEAYAVSTDGKIVIGRAYDGNSSFKAVYWNLETGEFVNLGTFKSNNTGNSFAYDVSEDESVIVEYAHNDSGYNRAFVWKDGQKQELGTFGGTSSIAYSASADGKVVVGYAKTTTEDHAFVWTEEAGLQDLNELFKDYLEAGEYLKYAYGVSANGRYVVGVGVKDGNDQAFVIDLTFSEEVESWPPKPNDSSKLWVYFLNVDQADSILLKGPDFTILIDARRHDRNDVLGYLQKLGIKEIDLLIGTHPHSDHIGQFPAVLDNTFVKEVWMSGDVANTTIYERTIEAILRSQQTKDTKYREPRAGYTTQIGSATIEVLSPKNLDNDFNNNSIVVRIVFGNVALLFTGDAESVAENIILTQNFELNSQILKVGHHDSKTSSSSNFLSKVKPKIAIYQAGIGNPYNHPHDEAIQRLISAVATIYGTDVHGTIVVVVDGNGYQVLIEHNHPSVTKGN